MVIKYHLAFKLRPSGRNNIVYLIQLHVTYGGDRIKVSTGCQINEVEAWDAIIQKVVSDYMGPDGETALAINEKLKQYKEAMEWTFKFFEVNDIAPSAKQVSDKFQERLGGREPKMVKAEKKVPEIQKELSFFEVFDKYTKDCGEMNAWTEATYEKMSALRVDLLAFMPMITFQDINVSTLTRFVVYLRDEKILYTPRKKKTDREENDVDSTVGLRNTSIKKKLEYFKMFLNWATLRGYNKNLEYKTFRPTLKTTQRTIVYLTVDEMTKLKRLDLSSGKNAYLEPIRDLLLFACFCGLRYSDINNIKRSDVKEDYLISTNIKTGKTVYINYNKVMTEILDKYKNIQFKNNKALPTYSNQDLNREVKKLCKLAGIDEEIMFVTYKGAKRCEERYPKYEKISSHVGRHTFIVQALSRGIAPNVVMEWTGHRDYKSMLPYIKIVDSIKAQEMKKFDLLLPE